MKWTSILKKAAMAITGLGLILFLFTHFAATLLIYARPRWFNGYADLLESVWPLIYLAEAGLLLFFLLHVYSGIRVTIENRRARAERYAVHKRAGEATNASRTMAA